MRPNFDSDSLLYAVTALILSYSTLHHQLAAHHARLRGWQARVLRDATRQPRLRVPRVAFAYHGRDADTRGKIQTASGGKPAGKGSSGGDGLQAGCEGGRRGEWDDSSKCDSACDSEKDVDSWGGRLSYISLKV